MKTNTKRFTGAASSDCIRNSRTRYHLYVLRDPDTNQVRYVGCCQNPRTRYIAHLSQKIYRGKWIAHWIDALLADGKQPVMEVVCCCVGKETARRVEQHLIRDWFNVVGGALCNCQWLPGFISVAKLEEKARKHAAEIESSRRLAQYQARRRTRCIESESPIDYRPHVKKYTHDGMTLTLRQWAERLGISRQRLHQRLKKHSVEVALSRPKQTA